MGEHIDNRGPKKTKKLKEHDPNARRVRVSFKRYLQSLEEELLEADDTVADEPMFPPDRDE